MPRLCPLPALFTALAGCQIPPGALPPFSIPDAGIGYADTVVAFARGGNVTSCVSSLSPCGTKVPDGGAACSDPTPLGPPDGKRFPLGKGEALELGWLCSTILDRVGPDFTVVGTLSPGASAVVAVSTNGSDYQTLAPYDKATSHFDLTLLDLRWVRFVRISNAGGPVEIDAVTTP